MNTGALIRQRATANHKRAARELATFLALFDLDAMRRLVDGLRGNLRSREAICVAIAAIMAVDPHDRFEVMAALEQLMPEPPAEWPESPLLLDPDFLFGEARLWAHSAWPIERRAYAFAALATMSRHEQLAIFRAFGGGVR